MFHGKASSDIVYTCNIIVTMLFLIYIVISWLTKSCLNYSPLPVLYKLTLPQRKQCDVFVVCVAVFCARGEFLLISHVILPYVVGGNWGGMFTLQVPSGEDPELANQTPRIKGRIDSP